MIPILGFAPDADPTRPGVITDCDGLIPFDGGMKGAPAGLSVGVDALAAACRGAYVATDLTGNRKVFAGTAAALYLLSGTTWGDVKSGAYTLAAEDRWSFAQYGNSTLAATPSVGIQRYESTAFTTISGAPQAKIIETASGFAVAFNTSTNADEWYCSAYLDETDWTLDVSTQCVSGRLIDSPGPITAAKRFQSDLVAYKGRSMYIGRYQGPPAVWVWTQVSTDVGCVGINAVADTPLGHVFVGDDDVYVFDGTAPRPLNTQGVIRKWLFADMDPTLKYLTSVMWDAAAGLVWVFYPQASSTTLNRAVVYHVATQRWGVAHRSIEAVVTYESPSVTYDTIDATWTYDSMPDISYESSFWTSGSKQPAYFDTAHTVQQLTGASASAYFVTGDFGDDAMYSQCNNVRVRYTQDPTTSACIGYVKDTAGMSASGSTAVSVSDGQHHVRQRARWHRFRFDTTGDFQVVGITPDLKPAGRR